MEGCKGLTKPMRKRNTVLLLSLSVLSDSNMKWSGAAHQDQEQEGPTVIGSTLGTASL